MTFSNYSRTNEGVAGRTHGVDWTDRTEQQSLTYVLVHVDSNNPLTFNLAFVDKSMKNENVIE